MRNQTEEQTFSSAIVCSSSNLRKSKFSQVSEYREERFFANVWVQLLLFINVYFGCIWLASNTVTLYYEYFNLTTIHCVLSILSLTIAAPIECLRLYLGYSGNLLDKIPDFAGFWILSVFIQTPLQIYLMTSEHVLKYTASIVVQGVQCVLLVLQVGSSFSVIRRASNFRREQFQSQKANILDGRQNSNISIVSD
uniref:Putative conserved plasma membrane protein n=1 Tax=Culex tarsalis TaxID=7177 RepID=A0A1Q3FU83_CULTA